jgi:prevent-host-death family protein
MKGGMLMPTIRSSTELRSEYTKISKLCRETGEPVFVTVNGNGDLAVMSIEAYEQREETLKIREKLLEAQLEKAAGSVPLPFDDAMNELEAIARGEI